MQWSGRNEISLRNNLIRNRILPETRRAARRVRRSRPSSRRDAFGRDELRPSPGLSRQPQTRREAEEDTLSALAHHPPVKICMPVTSMPASQDLHSRNFHAHLSLDAAINEVDSPPCETRAAGDTPPPPHTPIKKHWGRQCHDSCCFQRFLWFFFRFHGIFGILSGERRNGKPFGHARQEPLT